MTSMVMSAIYHTVCHCGAPEYGIAAQALTPYFWIGAVRKWRPVLLKPDHAPNLNHGDIMAAEIRTFPCLNDNFGYLIHDPATKATASIDAPEAGPDHQGAGARGLDADGYPGHPPPCATMSAASPS